MRIAIAGILLAVSCGAFAGDVYVNGYTRSDGRYVEPYHRTTPDNNPFNNYSTQGNVNPFTGHQGTVNPYPQQQIYQPPQPIYQQPQYQQPQQYQMPQMPMGNRLCPNGLFAC